MDNHIGMARRMLAADPGGTLPMLFGGWTPEQLHALGKSLIKQAKDAGFESSSQEPSLHYAVYYGDRSPYDRDRDRFWAACHNTSIISRREGLREHNLTRTRTRVTCGNCLRSREYRRAMGEDVGQAVHYITRSAEVIDVPTEQLMRRNPDYIPYKFQVEPLTTVALVDGMMIPVNAMTLGQHEMLRDRYHILTLACNPSVTVQEGRYDETCTTVRTKVTCKTCLKTRVFRGED